MIAKPQDPSWNVKFIDSLVKELIESEQVLGSYGVKTSKDMVQILKKYMIDSVRTKLITSAYNSDVTLTPHNGRWR